MQHYGKADQNNSKLVRAKTVCHWTYSFLTHSMQDNAAYT